MKEIYFRDYEQFMDDLMEANHQNESVRIHFLSLVDELETLEQVIILQMATQKLHVPCVLYFPLPDPDVMAKGEYEKYIHELSKLDHITLQTR